MSFEPAAKTDACTQVQSLTREAVLNALAIFPEQYAPIRRAQIRVAFRRMVLMQEGEREVKMNARVSGLTKCRLKCESEFELA